MLGADETVPNAYPVRRMPAPAQLLHRLNREMVRLQKCGFIACLCARIVADGTITIANASEHFSQEDDITGLTLIRSHRSAPCVEHSSYRPSAKRTHCK